MSRILANGVGAIGAIGQAGLLFHSLADCYPYKLMSNPPYDFYETIGYTGLLLAPITAIGFSWWLSKRNISYTPAVTCLLCPMVFCLIFTVAHLLEQVQMENTNNFDQTTPAVVFSEFINQGLGLLVWGVLIGTLLGVPLWFGSKRIGREQKA